jgi:hypothetical protein
MPAALTDDELHSPVPCACVVFIVFVSSASEVARRNKVVN